MRMANLSNVIVLLLLLMLASPAFASDKIYWTDSSDDTIKRANLDGTNVEVVVGADELGHFLEIDVDAGLLFWTASGIVFRSNLDGGETLPISDALTSDGLSDDIIEINPVEGRLYYRNAIDPFVEMNIESIDYDGNNSGASIQYGSFVPLSLAVDNVSGSIYSVAGDVTLTTGFIRAGLQNEGVEPLLSPPPGLAWLTAIDEAQRKVYLHAFEDDRPPPARTGVGTLFRTDLEDPMFPDINGSSNAEVFVEGRRISALEFDAISRDLYWYERVDDADTVEFYRSNEDGSQIDLLFSGAFNVGDIALRLDPPAPCGDAPLIDSQYIDLAESFELPSDLDNDGLPETASLALIEAISCQYETPLGQATNQAYAINLATFDEDTSGGGVRSFREAIAALMLIGAESQDLVAQFLALSGDYAFVQCAATPDACQPVHAGGAAVAGQHAGTSIGLRGVDEPLSGAGDPDQDGATNATEFDNVMNRGGSVDDFVAAATDSSTDGSSFIAFSSGGGGSCFIATVAYGTPLASEIQQLRLFRDEVLLTSPLGMVVADTYYKVGPSVATRVASSRLAAPVRAVIGTVLFIQSRASSAEAAAMLLVLVCLVRSQTLRMRAGPDWRPRGGFDR